jgi:hypothetical protein
MDNGLQRRRNTTTQGDFTMCMCKKPTINGHYGYQWNPQNEIGVFPVHAPAPRELDEIIIDEPGRCGHGIDSHYLHLRVVKSCGKYYLLTDSPRGVHRLQLASSFAVSVLEKMDSDSRYWTLQMIHHTAQREAREATQAERKFWMQAAADNRIKKRKMRNKNQVDVWVLNHDVGTLKRSLG